MNDTNTINGDCQVEDCISSEKTQSTDADCEQIPCEAFTENESIDDTVSQDCIIDEHDQESNLTEIQAENTIENSSITSKNSQCEHHYEEVLNNAHASIISNLQENNKTLHNDLNEVSSALETLNKQFAQRLQYDEVKETIIDRQHKELEEFHEGLNRSLQRPLLYDIAEALDDIRKTKLFYAKKENSELAIKALEGVEDSLNYILEKNNVECVSSPEGDPFTGAYQRMIKSIPTADITKQKTIAESIAPGYIFGKETLFKEKVIVYKYVPDYTETEQQVQPAEAISTPTPGNEETAESNTLENTNK